MSETRANTTALSAALSGPAFEGAASRSALHASERHVERWASESPTASRSRGLRSLAFADRVASPWMSASTMMNPRTAQMFGGSHGDRSTPGVSWVFPRPWFQDELDWMAAARQAAEQTPQFLTTRGTYASARTSPSDVVMPVVAPELVVPSMMAGSRSSAASAASSVSLSAGMVTGMSPAAASVQHGLRAWSPSVPFAAAAAAEVVAGAISAASTSGLAAVAERSPLLAGLTMVSPASLSGMSAPRAGQAAAVEASTASLARIDHARRPDPIAPEVLATLIQPSSSAGSSAASDSSSSASSSAYEAPRGPAFAPSAAEVAVSSAVGSSPAMAGALRAIDLLIQASSSAASSSSASAAAAASSAASLPAGAGSFAAPSTSFASSSSSTGAYSPSSAFTPSPGSTFAPVVGPRVAMPAGLGGLTAALETAHTIAHPMARAVAAQTSAMQPSQPLARAAAAGLAMAGSSANAAGESPTAAGAEAARADMTPGFRGSIASWSPVWAQPQTALASVAGERARGVDHLAWSDRWLARFAGASSVALTALDVARGEGAPAARLLAPNAPEVVYLHPELGAARLRAAVEATRQGQPLPERAAVAAPAPVRPSGALRIDDGASTPDSVFAALFSPQSAPASAPARRRAEHTPAAAPVERPPVSMVDAVRGGARPTPADLVSISAPTAPDAGQSAGRASSPMAAARAGEQGRGVAVLADEVLAAVEAAEALVRQHAARGPGARAPVADR
jgi:hypothetical protein